MRFEVCVRENEIDKSWYGCQLGTIIRVSIDHVILGLAFLLSLSVEKLVPTVKGNPNIAGFAGVKRLCSELHSET